MKRLAMGVVSGANPPTIYPTADYDECVSPNCDDATRNVFAAGLRGS